MAAPKITEIIEYEGNNKTFIWKHPSEDFNSLTQLIVHQSQEAIFFMNGEALDLFGPGRHTLETQNIPLLRRVLSLTTGGQTPFHCEVYFINKTEQMAIKWGTDSRVQFLEPTYQFPIQIGASGEMSLRVEDSRKLLVKLVGTENYFGHNELMLYFRSLLLTHVKSYLAQTIKEQRISIFEIDEHLATLSGALRDKLVGNFMDYGMALERFFITTVVKPDGEAAYENFKSLHFRQYADVAEAELRQKVGIIDQQTEAQKTVIQAQGLAQKRNLEGYTYQQERGFDVAEKIAQNEAAGNFTNMGIGLGMMTGVGSSVGGVVGGVIGNSMADITPVSVTSIRNAPQSTEPAIDTFCENCGTKISAGALFCDECGTATAAKPSCRQCGHVFERPGKFCPKCGAKREELQ